MKHPTFEEVVADLTLRYGVDEKKVRDICYHVAGWAWTHPGASGWTAPVEPHRTLPKRLPATPPISLVGPEHMLGYADQFGGSDMP